jgi:hypothetical protein
MCVRSCTDILRVLVSVVFTFSQIEKLGPKRFFSLFDGPHPHFIWHVSIQTRVRRQAVKIVIRVHALLGV